jgi:alanyl-tRNA synthetase
MIFQKKFKKVLIACCAKCFSVKAGEWIKNIAPILGGGGGGRDDFAQAGGKYASKLDEAVKKAEEFVRDKI